MKIAIITFQDAINYGAVMQAYALRTVLNRYGECDIINYYNEFFHQEKSKKNIKYMLLDLINSKYKKRKTKEFQQFQKNYLGTGEKFLNDKELKDLNDKYDIFVTGSDQVWNTKCSGDNMVYFLNFVKETKKKASYAASFGSAKIDNSNEIKVLLSDFAHISVRENSGGKILTNMFEKNFPVVLDPTLLLDSNEWLESFKIKNESNYVLVYEVLNGRNILSYAKKYAKDHNLKIKYITSSNKPRFGVRCIKDASPEEWLKLIANSSYVFTNSFHGLAFSLIFEKQFAVELLPPPAITNARLIELLDKLDLNSRVIVDSKLPENLINYSKVNKKLEDLRRQSYDYIEKMLQEVEDE